MSSMTVYRIDPLSDPRWASLVQKHEGASAFHTPGWLTALRQTYNYRPVVFTTSPPGAELTNGVLFCPVRSWITGNRLVSLPFSDHCSPLVDSSEELQQILDFLRQDLARNKWRHIEIRPREMRSPAVDKFEADKSYYFHTLSLSASLDELFRRFHKDCIQRKVHRALREKLRYEEGRSPSLLDEFYHLLVITRQRQGLPPQPKEWFRNLIGCLADKITIRVVSKENRPIASILTLSHKQSVIYKYGCSDPNFNNLGGTPLLFWNAITEAKNNQFAELDLGRSDRDNPGLATFKDRLGAVRSDLVYFRYPGPRSQSTVRTWRSNAAKYIVARMPNGLLTATGKALYRHVG
jgi:CelD/BcsL family acetyltransferase involved in cellulose biosynthesis